MTINSAEGEPVSGSFFEKIKAKANNVNHRSTRVIFKPEWIKNSVLGKKIKKVRGDSLQG